MAHHWWNIPRSALIGSLILALTFLVACGTAAPEVVEREVIREVQVEVPKEVEVVRQVEVPVEVEKEVLKEVEVVKEVEVLKEIPKETVVERTVIATPTPIPAVMEQVEAKVDRVIYALGEVQETNRHWTVSRPSYYQFDPYAETLIGLDAQTNERIPRLAESWETTPDGRTWTFNLVEGVPFHYGYGEFTSADVIAAFDRVLGDDAQSSSANTLLRNAEYSAIDDYTVELNFPTIAVDTAAILSRGFGGGEILMLSKNQFDNVGVEGFDEQPAGTGSYQYLGREVGKGIWFEKAPGNHWRGENPDFQEVELRWVREDLTRLAALLTGEIHVAALSRELQLEAGRRGMLPAAAGVPTNYLSLFLGGQYYAAFQESYDPSVPWASPETGKLVRQAMNKAINRQEMLDHVLKGDGEIMLITQYHPVLGVWNDQWEADWEEHYGYDPDAARELMAQAGYTPDNPMPFTSYNYFSADEPETAVMLEALINYWEPVGIDVTLLDSEWGTVRSNYRERTDFIKKGGWGNVITMRALTTHLRNSSSAGGTGGAYHSQVIEDSYAAFQALDTADWDFINEILLEVGDDRYYNFGDIPFFWFRLTVMFNPEVVESWTFPGTAGSKTSHWNLLKAAQ
ncbi:MAG: ABC transporter substrate-binding protein [Chloroflexota bacterium]|nr:ABC transporter substrate-binding protein [Chloroflexota bacterium]